MTLTSCHPCSSAAARSLVLKLLDLSAVLRLNLACLLLSTLRICGYLQELVVESVFVADSIVLLEAGDQA